MMPASPPPAPNPWRAPPPSTITPIPTLWLGTKAGGQMFPTIGKSWIN